MIFKYLKNYQPGTSKVKLDLKEMKTDIGYLVERLVPWDRENQELLSFDIVDYKINDGLVTTAQGAFTSIYHEPLIAFSYKKYISKNTNAVLYMQTSKLEFIYRIKNHKMDVHINRQLVGTVKDETKLYSAKTKRLVARINGKAHESKFFQIILKDQEIGQVLNPAVTLKHNPPVFEFLKDILNPTEEAVLLILAMPKMLNFAAPLVLLD